MNKFIGRVVTRMQGEDDALILGCVLDRDVIEADTVYSIEQCFLTGDIKLKKVDAKALNASALAYKEEDKLFKDSIEGQKKTREEEFKERINNVKLYTQAISTAIQEVVGIFPTVS